MLVSLSIPIVHSEKNGYFQLKEFCTSFDMFDTMYKENSFDTIEKGYYFISNMKWCNSENKDEQKFK